MTMKYSRVVVTRLVSDRGVRWNSFREEHRKKTVLRVAEGPDDMGILRVEVPGVTGLLDIPMDIVRIVPLGKLPIFGST